MNHRFIWWLCLCISISCLTWQRGWTQEVSQQSLFFHRFNLEGSPVTGNRITVDAQGKVYLQTMRTVWPNNKKIHLSWEGGYLVYSPDGELLGEFWGGTSHSHDISVMNGMVYLPCSWTSACVPQVYVFNAE